MGQIFMRSATSLASHLASMLAITLVAVLIRAFAQEGIPLYPDSYQFMLFTHGLSESLPVTSAMGQAGDSWAIPFHKLGYSLFSWPFSPLGDEPFGPGLIASFVAGTASVPVVYLLVLVALRSRLAAVGAATVMALSFSAAIWSRFVMSEAVAIFWIALTLLLAALAGRVRYPYLGVLTAISAALMILTRLELVLLLPTVALLTHGQERRDWSFERRYLLLPGLLVLAAFSAIWGWLAQDIAEGFSLHPGYLLRSAFSGWAGTDRATAPPLGVGLWNFVGYEPLLAIFTALGVGGALTRRDKRLLPLAPSLVLLLLAKGNDFRFLATAVPLLACIAGFGVEFLGEWSTLRLRELRDNRALALSAVISFGVVILLSLQIAQTESRPLPDKGYEYELAQKTEEHVQAHHLEDVLVCTYSPEAIYLVTEFAARRLSSPQLNNCMEEGTNPRPVLVIVDEGIRRHLGDAFEEEVRAAGTLLFEMPIEAPYLDASDIIKHHLPATAYLLR